MIDPILFAKGLAVGVAVAAPVGPVGALCMRRAVSIGRIAAIGTGLGAAVADAFYGAVAALGLTAISDILIDYQKPAAAVGGFFLLYLSYRIFRSIRQGSLVAETAEGFSITSAFLSTFFITLTNPATIISFVAIFAGIGFLNQAENVGSAVILVGGVFCGSALWWVFLSLLSHEMKRRFGSRFEAFVNMASASIIGIFGVLALTSLAF